MQVERSIAGLPAILSGERVSNTRATCPTQGDNTGKPVLIPHKTPARHRGEVKTMGSRPERVIGHIGTEIRSKLLREAAVGNIGQWAKALPSNAA